MGVPVLAPNSTWFSQGGTTIKRASITQINIVESYTPTGNETTSWDASAALDGSVMVYVTGTVLTIAGNGSGKIMANADSSYVFSNSGSDKFVSVTFIDGADLLDTSNATTMNRMFAQCKALASVDVSKWNTSSCTNMYGVFQVCLELTELDLSGWDVSGVTTMYGMFMSIQSMGNMKLSSIGDVSDWDVGKVETMQAMFQLCTSIVNLDLSGWKPSSCVNMSGMFYHCTSLEILDVSNWEVSKVTNMSNMFSMSNYGSALTELDVSKWNPESCTDMSFMFYGLNGLTQPLDVSNWDVSKVTSFDHMMAHSYAILNGVENWVTTSATNMNAMFHSVQNTSLDVSKFDTSNVQFFSQMFQSANKLTKIIGLENFNTANGLGFEEMFQYCSALTEIDLSSFDTRKAKDGVVGSPNGHLTATMQNMFQDNFKLKKISLGVNFSFKGDGTTTNTANYAVLPTPSADYIYGADGNWYTEDGTAYAPADVPSNTAGTYYASLSLLKTSAGKDFVLHRMFSKPIAHALTGKWFW